MKSNHVTQKCNSVHRRMSSEEFRKIGKRINYLGRDFYFRDFPMKKGTFRQMIHRLKDEIVLVTGGRPSYYRFKDVKTGTEKGNVTLEGMGVGKEFEEFLRDAKIQHPQIHDIKLKFKSKNLHSILKKQRRKVDPSNQRIIIPSEELKQGVTVKISVYPSTVVIDIGCSTNPLVYDTRGAQELIMYLQSIHDLFRFLTLYEVEDIPKPTTWIITTYHLNQDGRMEFSGEKFNISVENFAGGLIRCYTKNFPDGRTRLRHEQIMRPQRTVGAEISKMIEYDKSHHLDSLTNYIQ